MSLSPPEWILQWSEIVAGLGSVVLTIFLVMLYKRQQEQLAADHKAVLEVTDFEWDGDEATVYLSNFGNGVATALSLSTLVHVDTGEHRRYTARLHHMKRQDKPGEWSNTIQPGEEDIPFVGKSRIGEIAPVSWSKDWISTNFSTFVRKMRDNDADELKFVHVVKGSELSNERCLATLYPGTRSINPQNFSHHDSLENTSSFKVMGHDETFSTYFHRTTTDKMTSWLYYNGVSLINYAFPLSNIQPRPLDASGTKLVKRVVLWRNIRHKISLAKNVFLDICNMLREHI